MSDIETKTKTSELVEVKGEQQLVEAYAGFANDDAPAQERIVRLAGLVPVALQVMSESRDTVENLRDELDEARRPKYLTKSDWVDGIGQIQHNTLYDLTRQYKAVRERIEFSEYLAEVQDVFGLQVASAFQVYSGAEVDPISLEPDAE
jgi:hypothetical protein